MNRRQYLEALPVPAIVALAGCLEGVPGVRDASEPLADDANAAGATDREAVRHRMRAAGRLNRAAMALHALEEDLEDETADSFDADEPRDLIAAARASLERAAATDGGAVSAADVAELESYADALAGVLDAAIAVTDDSLPAALDELSEALDDRRLDDADAVVVDVNGQFETARERLDPALDRLEALDGDRLADLDIAGFEAVAAGARTLDDAVASLSALGAALARITTGHRRFGAGERELEADRYGAAEAAFDDAAAAYAEAGVALDGAAGAPGALRSYVTTARCQSAHLEAAADGFADSARAADDRDRETARERAAAGREALASAESCSE